jgi:hypothetical protein
MPLDSYVSSRKEVGVPGTLDEEERILREPVAGERDEELLNKLQSWLQQERDRQSENRYQMAIDQDFYDGLQWSEEDAQSVSDRGQAPLVFNETKTSLDWIIGTEKKNKVDWRVLPRTEDDQAGAETKTKVMKYISDVNKVPFVRSQAFAEAAICGLSWIEDSLSEDATQDILYSGWESWRNVLHDSFGKKFDSRTMRYIFRWRIIDLDVAEAMFPDKKEALRKAAAGADDIVDKDDQEMWYLGEQLADHRSTNFGRRSTISTAIRAGFNTRKRVKIYEAWYREPTTMEVVRGGAFDGEIYNPSNKGQAQSIERGEADHLPKLVMRMHCAFFTEDDILSNYESPFAHNDFPFTPVVCFVRGRDNMPYGFVRNIRDPQEDLNKRMSKSLFLLSVNQLITELGAFDSQGEYTLQDAIDNVGNPSGVFVMKDGQKRFEIRRDYNEITGQHEQIALNRQFIQSGSGVTDELLGRKTNATSGLAIEARQEQGSTTTSGIFDNYRLAISLSGQKALSNAEKFYALPKVIRLTESKDQIEWVKINQPELQPDGSIRFLNDITATKADFIVDEQDYRATMRQAMFESLSDMLTRIATVAPQMVVGTIDMLVDLADFPGKEAFVARLREIQAQMNGVQSPEQQAAAAELDALTKRELAAKIAKDEAAANKADAEADEIRMTLPATAVAMDLQNVSQAQAVTGATPMQPGETAQMQQQEKLAAMKTALPGVAPVGPSAPSAPGMAGPAAPSSPVIPSGVAQTPGLEAALQTGSIPSASTPLSLPGADGLPASPQQSAAPVQTGAATSSPSAPGAADPTLAVLAESLAALANIAQQQALAQQQVMNTLSGVATTLEGVASAVESVAKAGAESSKSAQAAQDSVKAVAETVQKVSADVEASKEQAAKLADAIVELKKPRNKTIEMKTADGKTITAKIKG